MNAGNGKTVGDVLADDAEKRGVADTWQDMPAIQFASIPQRDGLWQLLTSGGDDLGTFPGSSPSEAIRTMLFDIISGDYEGDDAMDELVRVWGGRAVCKGSVPAMPAVVVGP